MSIQLAARSGLRGRVAWWWVGLTGLVLSLAVAVREWNVALRGGLPFVSPVRAIELVVPALLVLGAPALHYAASGLALQAAAGMRLPARERYLSQLAAAAANRVTPGGVGGAALNARYLARRGSTGVHAVAAVGVLQVLGAVADVSMFATLFVVCSVFGLAPNGSWAMFLRELEIPVSLASRHPLAPALLAVGLGCIVVRRRARRAPSVGRRDRLSALLGELRRMRERPRDIAVLMGASASTTLMLGVGFAASVALVVGPEVWHGFFGLVIGYMLGSAVGNAAPVPSGIGTTDTALVGVVVASGVAMHQAVVAVLIFRVVSFWMPAALGLVAGAALRRRGAY